jgi:hypothetical protein
MSLETFSALNTTILAYLDPGSGSMQFQILVATLLSAGFFVKVHLVNVKYRIGRFFKRGE